MRHLRMWIPLWFFSLAFISFPFAAGEKSPAQQTKGRPFVKVKVEMVSLPVVVYSRDGRHVADLRQEDFEVFEDGIPQKISAFASTREPVSVALLLDSSGSTGSSLKLIQNEAVRFIEMLRPEDGSAIISFADEVHLLERFNLERKKNTAGIWEMRPGGLSAVYEAVWLALEQVLKHEYGRKALVLFSDGVDNRSDSVSRSETIRLARYADTTIYCIYFEADKPWSPRLPGLRRSFVQEYFHPSDTTAADQLPGRRGSYPELVAGLEYMDLLAEETGGLLVDASKFEDVGTAFKRIALELANQYSIGYYPAKRTGEGLYRTIEIKLKKPGLAVRTKKGYYASK